jgi:hypothetical protein
MKTLKITSDQINRAKKLYPFYILNNSITKGAGNITGALGEIIIHDLYLSKGYNVSFESTFDYDLIINDFKVDVKTKKTKVIPVESYLCSIPERQINQRCDYYYFLRIHENMNDCFVLGFISKQRFYNEAFFKRKGELDINKWTFKDNCYNIKIESLSKLK